MTHKKQQTGDNNLNLLMVVSALLAFYFVLHLLQLLQRVKLIGSVGSPSSYAGVPSGLLAVYVLAKTSNETAKYVAVIVLAILLMGVTVWLYGATGAGANLVQI